jgi:repressor LexA
MPTTNALGMLIKNLRQSANLTQTALGEKLGVGKAAISSYEKGKSHPSDTVLERLAKEFDLSIDTLRDELTGKSVGGDSFLISSPKGVPQAVSVRVYRRLPLSARATFAGSFAGDHDFNLWEKASVVPDPNDPDAEHGLVIDINGDSMDPQLRSGMRVLVEEVPEVDGWKLARPGVYVVVYRNHIVIKRIKENTLATKGEVWLHSDNPDGGRELVKFDDLRSMWRVVRVVHAPVH